MVIEKLEFLENQLKIDGGRSRGQFENHFLELGILINEYLLDNEVEISLLTETKLFFLTDELDSMGKNLNNLLNTLFAILRLNFEFEMIQNTTEKYNHHFDTNEVENLKNSGLMMTARRS